MEMNFIFSCCLAIYVIGGCGCVRGGSNSGVIDECGRYVVANGKAKLVVESDEKGLIGYCAVNESGDKLFFAPHRFSKLHRWAMFWDKSDRLWVSSSDVGTSVWIAGDDKKYAQYSVSNDNLLIAEMPEEIYQILPQSLRKQWDSVRSTN